MTEDANTFSFLLTTDNHLGYLEKDIYCNKDSFITFEECLRAARYVHDVDAVLLAGDLFHDNKPSLSTLNRALTLFSRYTLGDKPLSFSLVSDPSVNFPRHVSPCANFQDPNINVALPVFTINGNHDDPVGGPSAIEILSSAGLVNYFGVPENLNEIVLRPILLKKGTTRVALYGLGNVRDERLHRYFAEKKVTFVKPREPTGGGSWFTILLFHQNRELRSRASKNGIKESMLSDCGIDLVIWGNEHEQLMGPQRSEGYDIVQPGSTVRTQLGAETNPKQYAVLRVRGIEYQLHSYNLHTVRPFLTRTVNLKVKKPDLHDATDIENYLHNVAEEMLEDGERLAEEIPQDALAKHPNLRLPLLRINVDNENPDGAAYPIPNSIRFGTDLQERVANYSEVLRQVKTHKVRSDTNSDSHIDIDIPVNVTNLSTSDIRTKVAEVLRDNARDSCQLLSETEMGNALHAFIEKGDKDALKNKVAELLHEAQAYTYDHVCQLEEHEAFRPETIKREVFTNKKEVNKRWVQENQNGESAEGKISERAVDVLIGQMGDTSDVRGVPVPVPVFIDEAQDYKDDEDSLPPSELEGRAQFPMRNHGVSARMNPQNEGATKRTRSGTIPTSRGRAGLFSGGGGAPQLNLSVTGDISSV